MDRIQRSRSGTASRVSGTVPASALAASVLPRLTQALTYDRGIVSPRGQALTVCEPIGAPLHCFSVDHTAGQRAEEPHDLRAAAPP